MPELNELWNYIVMYAPVIIAIITESVIGKIVINNLISHFTNANKVIGDLKESPEYRELKNQMTIVLKENAELKVVLKKVLANQYNVHEDSIGDVNEVK